MPFTTTTNTSSTIITTMSFSNSHKDLDLEALKRKFRAADRDKNGSLNRPGN